MLQRYLNHSIKFPTSSIHSKTISQNIKLPYNIHVYYIYFGIVNFHNSNDFLRFHGDFFGVRGLFLCPGELQSPSFFSLGDVTNRLANQLLSSIVKTWNRVYKIRAAWIDSTRSWFFTPSNWSQYTLCSQMCFMKQTLLLYNFPEMTKKYVLFLWYIQICI